MCFSLATYGQGNSFDRVRYNGGSVDSKVDAKEWKNTLTVTSDRIALSLSTATVNTAVQVFIVLEKPIPSPYTK